MTSKQKQEGSFAENWSVKYEDYQVDQEILGQGASATVHRATLKRNGKECAIKKIDLEQTRDESDVQKEIKTLSSFRHDNIIAYYGCFLRSSRLCIVMRREARKINVHRLCVFRSLELRLPSLPPHGADGRGVGALDHQHAGQRAGQRKGLPRQQKAVLGPDFVRNGHRHHFEGSAGRPVLPPRRAVHS